MNAGQLTITKMVNDLREHDLTKMCDDAWNNLGTKKQNALIAQYRNQLKAKYPKAPANEVERVARAYARQASDQKMYDLAVQKKMPKSDLEFLAQRIAEGNSILMLTKGFARSKAGSVGTMQAEQEATQRYEKQGGFGRTVLGFTGDVVGYAVDPVTVLSMGAGGLAVKATTALAGKVLAMNVGKAVAGAYMRAGGLVVKGINALAGKVLPNVFGKTVAGAYMRSGGLKLKGINALADKMLVGMVEGGANFGTYQSAKEAIGQYQMGGHINPKTGENEGYSIEEVGKSALHGAKMGAAIGWLSPVGKTLSTRLARATKSTVGKVGIRSAEYAVTPLAEGTIFSIPEWIEGGRDKMDVWTNYVAMAFAFKGPRALKTGKAVIGDMFSYKNAQSRMERLRGFETCLRARADGGAGLTLTKDEETELMNAGYGNLVELVKDAEDTEKINAGRIIDEQGRTVRDNTSLSKHGEGYEAVKSKLQEMIEDTTISEASRAKMYYYATGRKLQMSTVMGSSMTKNPDGTFTVRSEGFNGVITSRNFKSKKQAENEVDKIDRLVELNSVEIGERYKGAEAEQRKLLDACTNVGRKLQADPVMLMRAYRKAKNRNAEELSEAERDVMARIDDALKNSTLDVETPEAIRTEIAEKHGVDVDSAISKRRIRRTEAEQKAVDEYVQRLFPEQKEAKNKTRTPQERQEELLMLVDENREQGYNTENSDKATVRHEMQQSRENLVKAMGEEIATLADNGDYQGILNILYESELSQEQNQALDDYVNAKARYDGMIERVHDNIDDAVKESDRQIDARTNEQSGMLHRAQMQDGRVVYITHGNVVMADDGKAVDPFRSDKSVIVVDAETGKSEFTSSSAIFKAEDPVSATEAKETAGATIEDAIATQEGDLIDGTLQFKQGDRYALLDDNGEKHTVQVVQADENLVQVILDEKQASEDGKPIVMPKELLQRWSDAETMLRAQQVEQEQAPVEAETKEEAETEPKQAETEQAEEKPTAPQAEQQPTADVATEPQAENAIAEAEQGQPTAEVEQAQSDAMPMVDDAKGKPTEEPDWGKATPQRAHEYIYNKQESELDTEEANAFVENMIAEKQKVAMKIEGKKPKIGTSIADYKRKQAEWQENLQTAQAEMDYWNSIKQIHDEALLKAKQERKLADAQALEEYSSVKTEGDVKVVHPIESSDGPETHQGGTEAESRAEPQPIGQGEFGPIYDQFKGKAKEAVEFLLRKKNGEAVAALHHKDIGDIDLVWGKAGTAHSDGFGLAKLSMYHPEVISNLQEILDNMVVTSRTDNRVQLESEKYHATVRLTWDNKKKTWLLTMFEKKNSTLSNTTDTDKTHKGNGNDTATPESTVISESKDKQTSATKQVNENKSTKLARLQSTGERADEGTQSEDAFVSKEKVRKAIDAYEDALYKFNNRRDKLWKEKKSIPSDTREREELNSTKQELQDVLLQLNTKELSDLLKQVSVKDTENVIENVLGVVYRQEQRLMAFNALLDKQGHITPEYKEDKKAISVSEFVETDKKRSELYTMLTGVFHDKGYVVGTDAHLLLARKEDYDKSLEGKVTNKKGEVLDGKYPDWRAAVSGKQGKSWGVNLEDLHAFTRGVLSKLRAEKANPSTKKDAKIAFKTADGKIVQCYANALDKALRGAKSIGAKSFFGKDDGFAITQTPKGYVVCPMLYPFQNIDDNSFAYVPRVSGLHHSTETLSNDTEPTRQPSQAEGTAQAGTAGKGNEASEVAKQATDKQGNPLNADGSLKVDKIGAVEELTDGDFTAPTRNVQLPTLPSNVDKAIGAGGKSVVIKKNIFEKNKQSHSDLTPAQSRDILQSALYNADLYGQNQKARRPYNWIVINTKDNTGNNRLVLLEVNDKKDNVEIIHWHYIREAALETIKRQAEREGGLILILPSDYSEEAGGLSSRTPDLSSDGKDSTLEADLKGKVGEKAENSNEKVPAALLKAIDDFDQAGKHLREGDKDNDADRWSAYIKSKQHLNSVLDGMDLDALYRLQADSKVGFAVKDVVGSYLQERENQEHLSRTFYSHLKDQNKNRPIQAVEKKERAIKPYDFVEVGNKVRPSLSGTYHDSGYVIGTDSYVLFARKENYPKSVEGKVTDKKGNVVDDTYINWKRLCNDAFIPVGVDAHQLRMFANGVEAYAKENGMKRNEVSTLMVSFIDAGNKVRVYNMKNLQKFLLAVKDIGAEQLLETVDGFLYAKSEKGHALCLPVFVVDFNDYVFAYSPVSVPVVGNEDFSELSDFAVNTDSAKRTAVDAAGFDSEALTVPLLVDGKPSRLSVATIVPDVITDRSYQTAVYDYSDDIDDKTNSGWQKWGDLSDEYNSKVSEEEKASVFGDSAELHFKTVDAAVKFDDWLRTGRIEKQQSADELRNDTAAKQLATNAVLDALDNAGISVEVVSDEVASEMLGRNEAKAESGNKEDLGTTDHVQFMRTGGKKKSAPETASPDNQDQPTVVSSADGAKILKILDGEIKKYENVSSYPNTFIGDVSKALGAKRQGSASEYASFETKSGKTVTIRLSNHNAKVSTFDAHHEA